MIEPWKLQSHTHDSFLLSFQEVIWWEPDQTKLEKIRRSKSESSFQAWTAKQMRRLGLWYRELFGSHWQERLVDDILQDAA